MVIKKKISDFIDKGADVKGNKEKEFKNILLRVPQSILKQLEETLGKKPWVSRNQWIIDSIHEKLKQDSSN